MRAHAHLRLIVSEPATHDAEDVPRDRPSMIQPLAPLRLRLEWLPPRALALLGVVAVVLYSVWQSFD